MNARKFEVSKQQKFTARMKQAAGAVGLTVYGAAVNAADWTTVTSAVDYSGEITGIQAIVGVIAGVLIVMTGAALILSTIKKK